MSTTLSPGQLACPHCKSQPGYRCQVPSGAQYYVGGGASWHEARYHAAAGAAEVLARLDVTFTVTVAPHPEAAPPFFTKEVIAVELRKAS